PLVVEMAVHAVEPGRHPAAARLEETHAQFRVTLDDATPDHAEARQHHLHRVRNDVLGGTALETVDADRWHAAAAALVEADREIVFLGGIPDRHSSRVVDQPVVVRVGPHEAAAHAEFLAREFHLLDG